MRGTLVRINACMHMSPYDIVVFNGKSYATNINKFSFERGPQRERGPELRTHTVYIYIRYTDLSRNIDV